MELHYRRPIFVALLCSLALHMLAVAYYLRWYESPALSSASVESSSLAVHLTPAASPGVETTPVAPSGRAAGAAPDSPNAAEVLALETRPTRPSAKPPKPNSRSASLAQPLPELNPVPVLQEAFMLEPATLSLQVPMDEPQQQAIQSALNQFAGRLPEWRSGGPPLSWREAGQEYQLTLEMLAPATATGLERAILSVTTEVDGLTLASSVAVKRMAFSHFAQVVDRWNPEVSLAGDRIDGRFHSNSPVFVERGEEEGPLVSGLATVSGTVRMRGTGRRWEVFQGGLETRARRLAFPETPYPWRQLDIAEQHRQFIAANSEVRFESGGYYLRELESGRPATWVALPDSPWLIIAGEDVELEVSGQVDGHVVMYSPSRITVTGSLTYASDPRLDPGSTDFLGLVSDAYIDIAAVDVTGEGDLELQAAIYAKRRFQVRGYRSRQNAQLKIFGSVSAGSLSATEPRFRTRLAFDSRLEEQRPAWFPLTNRYVIEGPEPAWTVSGIAALQ